MENYLPLILIVVIAGITLFAKKILETFYGNLFYLVLATFLMVYLIVTMDFSDPRIHFIIASLLFAGYVLVRAALNLRKLSLQKNSRN